MSNKFLTLLLDGKTYLTTAIATSTGVSSADSIVATGTDGKLDTTLLPSGLDIAAEDMLAQEDISAGDFVNIFDDAGTRKVRLADASNNRPAHGFALSGILTAATGTVYTAGINTQVSGLTPGNKYFLDVTPGNTRATITITPGEFVQALGTALSATSLRFEFDEPVYID